MSVKLIKTVWVPWKERGKKSGLDILAQTQSLAGSDPITSPRVSFWSESPVMLARVRGPCRAPGWANGAEQLRSGLTHQEPRLSGKMQGQASGLTPGDLILHGAINPTP